MHDFDIVSLYQRIINILWMTLTLYHRIQHIIEILYMIFDIISL